MNEIPRRLKDLKDECEHLFLNVERNFDQKDVLRLLINENELEKHRELFFAIYWPLTKLDEDSIYYIFRPALEHPMTRPFINWNQYHRDLLFRF